MPQTPDQLSPLQDWRLDLRLIEELPENAVVGRRFLGHTVAGVAAATALLFCGWTGYHLYATAQGITDWQNRISGTQAQVAEVSRLERAYTTQAARLDQIHRMMHNPIPITVFLAEFGRTLPPPMSVDMIETRAGIYLVRGTLSDSSERASKLIGGYVTTLTTNPVIGPHFKDIKLTGLERFDDEDGLSFEITLTPR